MKIKCNSTIKMIIVCFIFIAFQGQLKATLDLEKMAQSFVLETKQLEIPDFPEAFNPSITRWRGSLLLSFRVLIDPSDLWLSKIGLVWLDEDFNPVGTPQLLNTRVKNSNIPTRSEDARIFTVGDRLFVTYNDNEERKHAGVRRIYQAEIEFNGEEFHVVSTEPFLKYDGESPKLWEKNWTPFECNGEAFFTYSFSPHLIFRPCSETKCCQTKGASAGAFRWDWGSIKGGTPSLLVGDEYLGFFHSWKIVNTVQSGDEPLAHYFMGAYTFSPQAPYEITKISPTPIIGKDFYTDPDIYKKIYKHVIFPGGYVHDENYIWVVYGREDCQAWVVKLDKKSLFRSLVPVRSYYEYIPQST